MMVVAFGNWKSRFLLSSLSDHFIKETTILKKQAWRGTFLDEKKNMFKEENSI